MEREIPTSFIVSPPFITPIAVDDRRINPRFAAASFPVATLPFYGGDFGISSSHFGYSPIPAPDPRCFSYLKENLTAFPEMQLPMHADPRMKLKAPKTEPIEISRKQILHSFHHLPDLRSLETLSGRVEKSPFLPRFDGDLTSIIESSQKRFRSSTPSSPPRRERAARNPNTRPAIPSSVIARNRRKKISDRTKLLEKLMPWEKRMDIGTMLHEAYKYVKFLEAQITALETMPCNSAFSAEPNLAGSGVGGLERLNRQQMLQVMVNSPAVQDKLYERGFCVYSAEQVAALRQLVERNQQQVTLFVGSTISR